MAEPKNRKKIGEILIEQALISREDLEKALEVQKKDGGLLGEIFIRLHMVREEDIVIALATQFNFAYLPVENFTINPEATHCVPVELVKKFIFIPIDKMNDILTVVMSDPLNEDAVQQIREASGCRVVQTFVGTVSEIENAIKKCYRVTELDQTKSDPTKVKLTFQSATQEKKEKDKK